MGSSIQIKKDQKSLHKWYLENKRPLPWRANRNPYFIWISETMLQQTTTTAVIPFFKNFITKFPTLKKLAQAPQEEVIEAWAGLGYYSRARNLHKAAKALALLKTFPKTYKELIEYSGFGPYTSRSVSSIAFDEPVGVLDGNVIRILSRKHNLALSWWKTKERNTLQSLADEYVQGLKSSEVNQALMELGATICKPKNPSCLLCPWLNSCQAKKKNTIEQLPLKKAKPAKKIMLWEVYRPSKSSKKILLIKNNYTPFLKNQWLLPGLIKEVKTRPKSYDCVHHITNYDIYVQIRSKTLSQIETFSKKSEIIKVDPTEIKKFAPSSVLQKILDH